ncbi:MAG: hypothetical protein K6A35_09875 [bacterium]|nr:hypothetical protein [bacterium]
MRYPCADCGEMVETIHPGICKKCGSKKPFKCSKCGKHISIDFVFKIDSLTYSGKPIFCLDCGNDTEPVQCARCGRTLIRSTGVEIPQDGVLKVYHKECLNQQINIYAYVKPVIIVVMALLIGYLSWIISDTKIAAGAGAILGVPLGWITADKLLPHIKKMKKKKS